MKCGAFDLFDACVGCALDTVGIERAVFAMKQRWPSNERDFAGGQIIDGANHTELILEPVAQRQCRKIRCQLT